MEKIHDKLKPGDNLYEEARDKLEELSERFTKAVSGAYNRLFFPGGDGELVMATIDNGLSFGEESMPPRRRSKNCWPAGAATTNSPSTCLTTC